MTSAAPLFRQWLLLRTLSARHGGVAVRELAAELEVNDKTVRRDLELFRNLGFPLEETVADHGRKLWRLTGSLSDGVSFAFDEALALFLGRRLLEPLAGTVLWQAATNGFKKIRAGLGTAALEYLDRMAGSIYLTGVGGGGYAGQADLIDELQRAVEESKATHIVYRSQRATEPVTYEVYPYGLAYHRGSLYLVAHSREHDELRHFKVNRIEEAEVSAFPFQRPDDFDLARHFADSFGVYGGRGDVRIRVRFSPSVARYVSESTWHPSQRLTRQPDGGLLAEFRLSSTEEIKRWIMSFGRHALVESPAALRDEIAEELRALVEQYQPH
ncbi:MAG: WYL domain-containing protein [Pirellulales bacterium]